MRDENGLEKCVACGLCAVACPADAIYLEAAENDGSVQAGPRYAKVYQIHKTRCIFCGYCEEACPVSRDLHGQGLRARGLQQQGLHLGQEGFARPGRHDREVGTVFGALGDIHGDFASVRRIMDAPPRRPVLAVRRGCRRCGRPLRGGRPRRSTGLKGTTRTSIGLRPGDLPAGLHYIPNGAAIRSATVGRRDRRLTVAGLGGTFAPTMYDMSPEHLPHPKKGTAKATELADRRRHFVRAEVEACKALHGVDVLLTHEAPRPFRMSAAGDGRAMMPARRRSTKCSRRCARACTCSGTIIALSKARRPGIRSVCLDLVSRSYLLVDPQTLQDHVVL